jgi:hypothetical protein
MRWIKKLKAYLDSFKEFRKVTQSGRYVVLFDMGEINKVYVHVRNVQWNELKDWLNVVDGEIRTTIIVNRYVVNHWLSTK